MLPSNVTNGEIQAHVKKALQEGISDRILNLVDIGPYNVATAVVIRRPAVAGSKGIGNIGSFLSHDKVTEVDHILRGSGTQVTGGTMIGGQPNMGGATGPGVGGGKAIEGGRTSHLTAGDIQIIPPFVPHGWTSVGPEGIEYIVFRVDPEHVLAKKE